MASDPTIRTSKDPAPPRWTDRLTWTRGLYSLLSLPLGIVYVLVTLPTLVVSAVLSITVVGAVLFVPVLALLRSLAELERVRARHLLGFVVDEPDRLPPRDRGPLRGLRARLRDRQSWRDAVLLPATLPIGLVTFAICGLMVMLVIRAVAYPFEAFGNPDYYSQAWGGPTFLGAVLVHSGPGLLVVLIGPRLLKALTACHGRFLMRMSGQPRR